MFAAPPAGISVEQLLGTGAAHDITMADLEASIGTFTRLEDSAVDVTPVVVAPTPRSIDVAERAVAVATERAQGWIVAVANEVANNDDITRVAAAFVATRFWSFHFDQVGDRADREGRSRIVDPSAPAVAAIAAMTSLLSP